MWATDEPPNTTRTNGWSFLHCLRSSVKRGLQIPDMIYRQKHAMRVDDASRGDATDSVQIQAVDARRRREAYDWSAIYVTCRTRTRKLSVAARLIRHWTRSD